LRPGCAASGTITWCIREIVVFACREDHEKPFKLVKVDGSALRKVTFRKTSVVVVLACRADNEKQFKLAKCSEMF